MSTEHRYPPATRPVPVPLQQLNLKLSPAVLADWKQRAAAKRLTIREWLLSELAPAAPPAPDSLAERVAALEAAVLALEAVAARSATTTPSPSAVPSAALEALPDGEQMEGRRLAELLGIAHTTLSAQARRQGVGAQRDGWRFIGRSKTAGAGPDRHIWQRVPPAPPC